METDPDTLIQGSRKRLSNQPLPPPQRVKIEEEHVPSLPSDWSIVYPSHTLYDFKALGLPKPLRSALKKLSISSLYALQSSAFLTACSLPLPPSEPVHSSNSIPPVVHDICLASPTGSGKTIAFALSIYARISSITGAFIKAIVVSPTRDLAFQIREVFTTLFQPLGLKTVALVGHQSFSHEQNQLSDADIVVATPGRLVDHINLTLVDWSRVVAIVFDEADRIMADSFQDLIAVLNEKVFLSGRRLNFDDKPTDNGGDLFSSSSLQSNLIVSIPLKIVCSATLIPSQSFISLLNLNNPLLITTNSIQNKQFKIPETLKENSFVCSKQVKPLACQLLLRSFLGNSMGSPKFLQILVFCSSCEGAHRLSRYLSLSLSDVLAEGQIQEFSSELGQKSRNQVINQFRNQEICILVCSDLVSRGLDFPNVSLVLSYDIPHSVSCYVHRIGRTARANEEGESIVLLSGGEWSKFKKILHSVSNKVVKQRKIDQELIDNNMDLYQEHLQKLKEIINSED
ncbi:hypothetical protein P9112_009136 [Eukaryota sp. TZLM1-RC]